MPSAWPLVGRREELEFIERLLTRRGGRGVILAGAAGVGKTRLAAEGLEVARALGFATSLAIGTNAAANLPFGALAHLLPQEIPSGPDRDNVLRFMANAVIERSDSRRSVLGVDDAHLLDDHSAALLHYLALTEQAFLVLAIRTGEPAPDPLVQLWKDQVCERLELLPLSREETAELLEAALGSQVDGATSHRLWQVTRGNPLFLREVVLGALEAGNLVQTDGLWRWIGSVALSPRLTEVLGLRLSGLEAEERDVLEFVALGEPIEFGILESLTSPVALRRLERRGLLEQTSQGRRVRVRPSHPLYGEILRAEVTPARGMTIHAALAEALERSGTGSPDDLLRIAAWRLAAGQLGNPATLAQAAQLALSLFDYRLAERAARAATEAGAGFETSHVLATALVGQGKFDEAEGLLANLVSAAMDEAQRTQAVLTRANNLFWDLGREDEAFQAIEAAEGVVTDPVLRDDLAAGRAYLLFVAGRLEPAIEIGLTVLDHPTASDRAVASAIGAAGEGLIYGGRPEAGLRVLDRNWDRARTALQYFAFGAVALSGYRMLVSLFAGRLIEGARDAEQAHRQALDGGQDWVAAYTAGNTGMLLRAQGRASSATRSLKQAVVVLGESDVVGQRSVFMADLAYGLALVGDCVVAEETLSAADASRVAGHRVADGWFLLPRIWIAACRGETSAAIAEGLRVADLLSSSGLRAQEATALHDVARLGAPERVAERLVRLAESCDGPLIPAFARHTTALVARDALALEEISHDFEDMGALLLAAEAAAEASHAHRDVGSSRRALAAARARTLADLCEGARTPALTDIEEPLPLTRREREVAALAARGLTNQEIAERLVVSVRTVGNHLHSAYAKLEVTGRDELRNFPGLT